MAAFTLDRFDGSEQPIEVDHAVTLKQTGLTWVGQYYSQFGELILENMLHLSENFAGPNPPYSIDDNAATFNQLAGQLWYHTDDSEVFNSKILKIQDGNTASGTEGWKRVELIIDTTQPSIFTEGEMFYHSDRKTIDIARDNRWESLKVEVAYDSEKLIGIDGQYYMRKDIDQTMSGVLTATHIRPLTHSTYDLGTDNRRWRELFLNVLSTAYSRDLIPLEDATYDLGTESQKWRNFHVNVVRGDKFTDVIPLETERYDLGTQNLKWDDLYLRTAYVDRYSNILPLGDSTVGSSSNRWRYGYFNELDVSGFISNLSPRANTSLAIGTEDRRWEELYVNVIHDAEYGNIIPHTSSSSIGEEGNPFDTIYVRNLPDVKFSGDINFDIIRNDESNGITWTGLGDTHRIFVEETSNSSNTRLVIDSSNNIQDTTVFKNNGEDVLEVKQDKVEAHKDLQANKKLTISDGTGQGVSIEYNASIGAMEFKFI